MMESVSIDMSLGNIWKSWYAFRLDKRSSREMRYFEYYLESNLFHLSRDLESGSYKPSSCRTFIVTDNKRREISVSAIRDRVAHRLVYDYLVPIYDKTFIYDAWSCRVGKGLIGAILRTQHFVTKYSDSYVWRSDITKFFDSVDHEVLINLLGRRITCQKTLQLLKVIAQGYSSHQNSGGGA